MFSFIIAHGGISVIKTLPRMLERLEAVLAIAAGEVRGEHRYAVSIDIFATAEEFGTLAKNPDLRAAIARAFEAKAVGAFHVRKAA